MSASPRDYYSMSRQASVGRLATDVIHDINNPLMVISGNLELIYRELEKIESNASSQKIETLLNRQEEALKRITDLTSRLRTYVLARSAEPARVPIHIIAQEALQTLHTIFEKRLITVEMALAASDHHVVGRRDVLQYAIVMMLMLMRDGLRERRNGSIRVSTENIGNRLVLRVESNSLEADGVTSVMGKLHRDDVDGSILHSLVDEFNGILRWESLPTGVAVTMEVPVSSET